MISVQAVDFSDIKNDWIAFEGDGTIPTIFQAYGWIEPWWRHLGHGQQLLLAAYDGGLLVGIAPLFIERMTLKGMPFFRIVRFMGTPESDYHAFIFRKGREQETMEAFLKYLRNGKWDIAWLSDVKPDQFAGDLFERSLRSAGYEYLVRQHTPCPYITLPGDFEAYKASLSRNSRRNITKYCNRFEKTAGAGFHKISDAALIGPAMDTFIRLHGDWWHGRGQAGALNRTALWAFHKEVASTMSSYLDLKQLVINDTVVGTVYSYDFQGRRCVYLPGIDPAWKEYSPGYVMIAYNIRDAIGKGLREFDFMRGNEEYKYHCTGSTRHNQVIYFGKDKMKWRIFRMLERL
jgi:CelD/BcsL family acetyltransferase involved in cellulose biosynthesis